MMSTGQASFLAAAGVVAGLVGTAGGITSLVSYPALLAVGLPARAADIVNIVSFVGAWPGAALGSRPELHGKAPWLLRWLPVAAAGGALGAALLLLTPSEVFRSVVPFLVLLGSLVLLVQPWLSALRQRMNGQRTNRNGTLAAGLVGTSLYNGYFGAGAGVMTLALVLLSVDRRLPEANALKNMLLGGSSVVSAVAFVIAGPVRWSAVIPLAIGMFLGSMVGPWSARHVPAGIVRALASLMGVALAVELWLS